MAARSIGSLTVSFGLVAIPVKLYTATQVLQRHLLQPAAQDLRLATAPAVHVPEGRRVVERDEMVKGYEFAKDQYVRFTPEEIKALEEVGNALGGHLGVRAHRIDRPGVFRQDLLPRAGQGRGQALRRCSSRRCKQSGRCGVGHWAARGKAYIVILRPIGDVLAMQQLHYAADVTSASRGRGTQAGGEAAELKLAQQLIDQQTATKFDPQAYKDDVRARVEAAIQKKVEGQGDLGRRGGTAGHGQGDRSDGGAARQSGENRERAHPGHAPRAAQGSQACRGAHQSCA